MLEPLQSARNRILAPNLDDRTWQDLVNEAVALIPQYAPQWTDQNPSDLGMALVELFAFLVEGLTYRLNRVPDKNYIAFLNLLGVTLEPAVPARVYLTFIAQPGTVTVPKGTQGQTQGTETTPPVIFETDQAVTVLPINLTTAVAIPKGSVYSNVSSSLTISPAGGLTLTVPVGTAGMLCLGFDNSIAAEIDLTVALSNAIKLQAPLAPPPPPPPPEASVSWLYSKAGSNNPPTWPAIPAASVVDGTAGLQQNGLVRLTLPADWALQTPASDWSITPARPSDAIQSALAWVGILAKNLTSGPGAAPVSLSIDSILFNSAPAHNALTVTAEQLGISDGTAWQVFTLQNQPLYQEPDTDTPYDHLVVQVGGVTWTQVDDFQFGPGNSYKINPIAGEVSFGSYDPVKHIGNGSIPVSGAQIAAASYRYVVGGTSGNVGGGAVTSLRTVVAGITGVTNHAASTGAADQQPIEDAMRLAPDSIKARDRAVTAADYEILATQASTDVAVVRCLEPRIWEANPPAPFVAGDPWTFAAIDRSPGNVTVIIVPGDGAGVPRPDATPDLLRTVQAYLDDRRTLTARLTITGPRYVPIQAVAMVNVWQTAIDQGLATQVGVQNFVMQQIQQYLHPVHGGLDGSGWQVGQSVFIADLFKFIQPSDSIGFISSLALTAEPPLYHFPPLGIGGALLPGERPFPPDPLGVWARVTDFELVCFGQSSAVTVTVVPQV
jgi:predicted phage baseplate assembly protein